MICETCGKEILEDWRKDRKSRKTPLRFCSRACSNKRTLTEEQKKKISFTIKQQKLRFFEKGITCELCNKVFHTNDYSRKLCYNCLPKTKRFAIVEKVPESILDCSKRTVSKIMRRMDMPCSCCGFFVKGVVWDFHHIIPRKIGGKDDMSNITYICPNCHRIAHTDTSLLVSKLISVEQQLKNCGKNWLDFYYGYKKKSLGRCE